MAKMFYSLDEAAQKLGKKPAEVRDMAARGELTEFRDGDKLIFKVDQIDLLAGGDGDTAGGSDMSSMIPLSDTGGGTAFGLDLTDSGPGGSAAGRGGSGVSVFDEDDGAADPSADTLVTGSADLDSVNLESFGSGSGLMDLTREADDTSLGAEGLLDELYSGDDASVSDTAVEDADLFAGGGEDIAGAAAAAGPALAEAYDGRGSGLTGGLMIGATLSLMAAMAVLLMAVLGAPPAFVGDLMDGNMLIPTGILLGVTLILGGIGFAVGGRS